MKETKNTEAFQVIVGWIPKSAILDGTIAEWLLDTGTSVWIDEEGSFNETICVSHSHIWDRPVQLAIEQGDRYFMDGMLYEAREEFRKAVIYLWEKYYIRNLDDDNDVELMSKLKLVIKSLTHDIECE